MNPATPDLLTGLGETDAARILALGIPVTLAAGEVLFRLGETAEQLYLVRRGRIALSLPMQIRGRTEDILLEEKRPGDTLGWSGLIPPHRYTLNASAPVECELLGFPRDAMNADFARHPEAGYTVIRNVAAVTGHRLQAFQAMWLREMQRVIELRYS